jgi:hypothetical protein
MRPALAVAPDNKQPAIDKNWFVKTELRDADTPTAPAFRR